MKFPSKVTPFKESVIAKFPIVLEELKNNDLKPDELYTKIKNKVNGPSEFLEIMDCLYVLDVVNYNDSMGVLQYVKRN